MSKLAVKQINTYHIDWLTYSYHTEKDQLGLGKYLAQCMGLPEKTELDLLEAGNDSDYALAVKIDDNFRDDVWVKDREEQWEAAKKNKGFEHWRLQQIVEAAVERGFLAEGNYLIKLSW